MLHWAGVFICLLSGFICSPLFGLVLSAESLLPCTEFMRLSSGGNPSAKGGPDVVSTPFCDVKLRNESVSCSSPAAQCVPSVVSSASESEQLS